MVRLALLLLTSAVAEAPASETLSWGSLPKPLRAALSAAGSEATFAVDHFDAGQRQLWIVRAAGSEERRLWRLEKDRAVWVGAASGPLLDWVKAPNDGWPSRLVFADRRGPETALQLDWTGEGYVQKRIQRVLRDPLTREPTTASAQRDLGLADLQAGRYAVAAGRYALVCEAIACSALDYESLATGALAARLFGEAERALRLAVELPDHQDADWQSLASLLRAQGRNSEAAAAENRLNRFDAGRQEVPPAPQTP